LREKPALHQIRCCHSRQAWRSKSLLFPHGSNIYFARGTLLLHVFFSCSWFLPHVALQMPTTIRKSPISSASSLIYSMADGWAQAQKGHVISAACRPAGTPYNSRLSNLVGIVPNPSVGDRWAQEALWAQTLDLVLMEEDGYVHATTFDLRHQGRTVRASHLFAYYTHCRTDAFYCCEKPYLWVYRQINCTKTEWWQYQFQQNWFQRNLN
jgi:hypothetical protein